MSGGSRGVNFELLINYIKKVQGTDGVNEFEKRIKKKNVHPDLKVFRNIRGKDWYPVEHEFVFLEELDRFLGNGDGSRCRAFGAYSASDLGFLKYFVKWLKVSPETIAKKADEDWPKAYKQGRLFAKSIKQGEIVMRIEDFPSNEYFCHNIVGLFEGVMELSGRKGRVEHFMCTSEGGEACEYRITY